MRRHRFDDVHTITAFDHHFNAVLSATAARDRLDEQIIGVAASPPWSDPLDRHADAVDVNGDRGLLDAWTELTR
jgi:hypothetical protein